MIERGCSARFAAESLDCLRDPGNVVGEEFQRNAPAEARVLGSVNHAHPAAAKLFQDVVVGQRAADDGGSIGHWLDILRERLHPSNRAREAGWVQRRSYSQKWPPLCISEPPSDNFRIVGKQEVIRFLSDRPDSPANAASAKPASNFTQLDLRPSARLRMSE